MSITQWINKIKNKLFVNHDYFKIEQLKMTYIENRIENFATKHLNFRMRDKTLNFFLFDFDILQTLKNVFDDFNRKLIVINEFRALRMSDKNFYFFWAEFQRISVDLNYNENTLMTKMIHKLHSKLQRLIMIEHQIANIYNLTKQCQRIYEKDLQIDKTKRVTNRINQQKQRQFATFFDVVVSSVMTFAFFSFFRKSLFESKFRLFDFSSNATFRLISKEAQILSKQKRCFKYKESRYVISSCESEYKSMSAELKEIVKLFDSKN